ncbi:hypothetical protein DFJ77DRAFT_505904 [Powellomyces hirtus]|nr:hypothetical protein DFJ77DRAFT_505904 [Powellomyces hirtus]
MESWTAARNRERDIQHGVLTTDKDAKRPVEFLLMSSTLQRLHCGPSDPPPSMIYCNCAAAVRRKTPLRTWTLRFWVTLDWCTSTFWEKRSSRPNAHTIVQINEAIRDGLRAVSNAIEDQYLVPGAAAFQDVLVALQEEHAAGHNVGIDLVTGETLDPVAEVLRPNITVTLPTTSSVIASNFLLVDEMMRAGRSSLRQYNAE